MGLEGRKEGVPREPGLEMREGAGGGARYPPREHGAGAAQGVQGGGGPTEGIIQGTSGRWALRGGDGGEEAKGT